MSTEGERMESEKGWRVRRGEVQRWIVGKGEGRACVCVCEQREREQRGLSPAPSYLSSLLEF